ncbi:hypothetical protein evm_013480 [Chilo suppressalis]|nr:hypothetical protein evm_013480 [Chilo suppressalis]
MFRLLLKSVKLFNLLFIICIVLCEIAEVFGNQIPALNFTASRKISLKEILGCPLYCHKRSRNGTANVLEIELARAPRVAIEVETSTFDDLRGRVVCTPGFMVSPTREVPGSNPGGDRCLCDEYEHLYSNHGCLICSNDLSRLHAFGSKTWAVILPRRSKFEQRGRELRMVGYSNNGYRLWNPMNNQIVESRDVRFDESDVTFKESKDNKKEDTIWTEEEKVEETEEISKEVTSHEQDRKENDKKIVEDRTEESVNENETEIEELKKTRSGRICKTPTYLRDYEFDEDVVNENESNIAYCLMTDPQTYEEAIEGGKEWQDAIESELNSLKQLDTWEEATLPKGKKAIDTKWVFRTKQGGKKKARLVAKGFQTENRYNFYSPVARLSTLRMMFCLAVQENLPIKQLDVPTAFLNGHLSEEVYIKPPKGVKINKNKVLKLKRSLYGLKEAPKCWNERFHNFIISQNFESSKYDFCLYTSSKTWILIWVDDIIVMGDYEPIIIKLRKEFNVKEMGDISEYLGMEISRKEGELAIKQEKLVKKVLSRFGMEGCKGALTPMEANINLEEEKINDVPYRELIGCLTYISTTTRPDITFAVSFLSKYLDKPTRSIWTAAKRVLRYLKSTSTKGLLYTQGVDDKNKLVAYSDADWASDKADRKRVSGCTIFYSGNLISWFTKKQNTVSLSSAEAEYIAGATTTAEIIYLQGILNTFKCKDVHTYLLIDSQSAIRMIECNENSKRTKHIDIKFHFVKDAFIQKKFRMSYVCTNDNVADIFTKPLNSVKHAYFVRKLKVE